VTTLPSSRSSMLPAGSMKSRARVATEADADTVHSGCRRISRYPMWGTWAFPENNGGRRANRLVVFGRSARVRCAIRRRGSRQVAPPSHVDPPEDRADTEQGVRRADLPRPDRARRDDGSRKHLTGRRNDRRTAPLPSRLGSDPRPPRHAARPALARAQPGRHDRQRRRRATWTVHELVPFYTAFGFAVTRVAPLPDGPDPNGHVRPPFRRAPRRGDRRLYGLGRIPGSCDGSSSPAMGSPAPSSARVIALGVAAARRERSRVLGARRSEPVRVHSRGRLLPSDHRPHG